VAVGPAARDEVVTLCMHTHTGLANKWKRRKDESVHSTDESVCTKYESVCTKYESVHTRTLETSVRKIIRKAKEMGSKQSRECTQHNCAVLGGEGRGREGIGVHKLWHVWWRR
jgi:hypothetical protein